MRSVALWSSVLLAVSCTPAARGPLTPAPLNPASPSEYDAYRQPGAFTLTGQAFLTTRGGDVKLAAGRLVTLDPATPYAMEWFRRFGASVSAFDEPAPDTAFQSLRRTTTADAEGKFTFNRLPPGEYIVRSTVTWETGAAYTGVQGGVVAALVDVEDAESPVILNQVYTPDMAATLGIEIIPNSVAAERQFRVLERITGTSCQQGMFGAAPTEDAARADLIIEAARVAAHAVTNVECAPQGMSWGCSRRVVCEGDAIVWL